jgi:deoxyribose-phosphate aldolase
MKIEDLCKFIDHTLLKPDAAKQDIKKHIDETIQFGFWSCCINQCWVKFTANGLKGTGIKVCSIAGFPLGASITKAIEAEKCVNNGADEIDMVMNIGLLKSGLYKEVENDIKEVVNAVKGKIVKVIIEAGLLSMEEKIKATKIVLESGAGFVKTNTGFGYGGAIVEDVKLLRKTVGQNFGVKASGGIRTLAQTIELINAGASRIGTSASISIVNEYLKENRLRED